jgi:hypothetical protein
MKLYLYIFLLLSACNMATPIENSAISDSTNLIDTTTTIDSFVMETTPDGTIIQEPVDTLAPVKDTVFSNKRFKDVRVQKIAADKYRVTGKGQIFESTFGWVLQDGNNELQSGNAMTDNGAPAWGNFDFVVTVKKKTLAPLRLLIYETSANDGSRQFQLFIPLP